MKDINTLEIESEVETEFKEKLEGILHFLGDGEQRKEEGILGIGIPFYLSEDDDDDKF